MAEIDISPSTQRLGRIRHAPQLQGKTAAVPAITLVLLVVSVFLLRLPSALVPRELNVDESHLLSQAMKLVNDPRPWIAADLTSSGPLNSYLIVLFLWMGFKAGFVLVHILANILVCLQIVVSYFTLRRVASQKAAALGTLLIVILYGVAVDLDYLQYASELLPSSLLMLGFYFLVAWLDDSIRRDSWTGLSLLFSCGLTLGAAPWCKLQAGPISGSLCLVVMGAILLGKDQSPSFSARGKALGAFCAGATLTTCAMAFVLIRTHAVNEFWLSYIQGNLVQANSPSLQRLFVHACLVFLITPIHQFILIGVAALCVYEGTINKPLPFAEKKWITVSLWIYLGAGLFAVCSAKYFFSHYSIFIIAPTAYLTTMIGSRAATKKLVSISRHHKLESWIGLMILSACLGMYVAYGVRYVRMVRVFHEMKRLQAEGRFEGLRTDWLFAVKDSGIKSMLSLCIGPPLVINDTNERITDVISDISKTHPVHSLAIWGWAPGVYVLTGIPPATRDSVGHFFISPGPMQKYFQARFLSDLRKNPPDLFIDTVATDAFKWPEWTATDGYESDPALRAFIDENYVLAYELKSTKGAKPVRLFVLTSR